MKTSKSSPIRNIDDLEKEILRLKQQTADHKKTLNKDLDHLEKHFLSMSLASISSCRNAGEKSQAAADKNKAFLARLFSNVTEEFGSVAEEKIKRVLSSFLHKREGL